MGSNDSGTLGNLSVIDDRFTANLPTSLFHYTDAGGFLGILSTRSIWATDSSCLNDRQELLYAKDLITDQLDRLCSHPDWDPEFWLTPDETKLLDSIRSSFDLRSMFRIFLSYRLAQSSIAFHNGVSMAATISGFQERLFEPPCNNYTPTHFSLVAFTTSALSGQ